MLNIVFDVFCWSTKLYTIGLMVNRFRIWCNLLEKKDRKLVRHSSGCDQDYTIFDALLENMIAQQDKESLFRHLFSILSSPLNLVVLSLVILGWGMLAWVGQIVWTDLAFWGKELPVILFGSRIGEPISLGLGVKLFHYLLIGVFLLVGSLIVRFVKKR